MSIEQTNVVDFISVDRESGDVLLTISDHLQWGGESIAHLDLLGEKVASYVQYVENGQIYRHNNDYVGRRIVINIVQKYSGGDEADKYLLSLKGILASRGIGLRWGVRLLD